MDQLDDHYRSPANYETQDCSHKCPGNFMTFHLSNNFLLSNAGYLLAFIFLHIEYDRDW